MATRHVIKDGGFGPLSYRVRYGQLQPWQLPPLKELGDIFDNKTERATGHFTKLIESVRREGFRNPVCWVDPTAKSRIRPCINWKQVYGGSRVCVAMYLQIPLPAIVSDRGPFPEYDDWEPICSVEDLLRRFRDPPTVIEFRDSYLYFEGCKQVHLESRDP